MRTTLTALLFALPLTAPASTFELTAAEWALPRHGESLLRMPALSGAVQELSGGPGRRLELRFPGGDDGYLWAQELRAWLVSLGVASDRIELVPGSASEDRVELTVRQGVRREEVR